jgi:hypothetical protein
MPAKKTTTKPKEEAEKVIKVEEVKKETKRPDVITKRPKNRKPAKPLPEKPKVDPAVLKRRYGIKPLASGMNPISTPEEIAKRPDAWDGEVSDLFEDQED